MGLGKELWGLERSNLEDKIYKVDMPSIYKSNIISIDNFISSLIQRRLKT